MFKGIIQKQVAAAALAFVAGAAVVGAAGDVIDALVIGDERIEVNLPLKFPEVPGGMENISLWGKAHGLGVQSSTTYFRSANDFAWFKGGEHSKEQRNAGTGGEVLMSLQGKDLYVEGKINGMGAVPLGTIVMWTGTRNNVPPGWRLAMKEEIVNGIRIPDLQGRFIVGISVAPAPGSEISTYSLYATGGSEKVMLDLEHMPAHDHGKAGDHTHKVPVLKTLGFETDDVYAGNEERRNVSKNKTTEITLSAGNHKHESKGKGLPFDNRPPYYALAFIVYVGV